MTLLELNGLGSLIAMIILVIFSPPIILIILGISQLNKNPKNAKIYLTIGVVYILIGAGICGSMLT